MIVTACWHALLRVTARSRADQREALVAAKIKLVAARATLTQLKVQKLRARLIDRKEAERDIGLIVKEAMQRVRAMPFGHKLAAELVDLLNQAPRVWGDCPKSDEATM